jgi:hypothetical protein
MHVHVVIALVDICCLLILEILASFRVQLF